MPCVEMISLPSEHADIVSRRAEKRERPRDPLSFPSRYLIQLALHVCASSLMVGWPRFLISLQLRKSKTAYKEQEKVMAAQMSQLEKQKAEITELQAFKASVAEEPATKKQMGELDRKLVATEKERDDAIKALQVHELQSRVEVKRARQAAASAKKDMEEAQREKAAVLKASEDMEKEFRAAKLRIKKLDGIILPLKVREAEVKRREAECLRLEALKAEVDAKLAYMEEPRVVLMTLLVQDPNLNKRKYKLASEMTDAEAAVLVQKCYRGFLGRSEARALQGERGVVAMDTRPEEEQEEGVSGEGLGGAGKEGTEGVENPAEGLPEGAGAGAEGEDAGADAGGASGEGGGEEEGGAAASAAPLDDGMVETVAVKAPPKNTEKR